MFGWTVLSVQITHSQDTKTYTSGLLDYYSGDKTVETTTINYATITYQRDKAMPNYTRIAALQEEAEALANEEVKSALPGIMSAKDYGIAFGFWMAGVMLMGSVAYYIGVPGEDLMSFSLIAPIIYLIFIYCSRRKQYLVKYGNAKQRSERCKNRKNEIAIRLNEIEAEARSLT